MVYTNIEYLGKDGKWHARATWAHVSGELLIISVLGLLSSKHSAEWRMRIRH